MMIRLLLLILILSLGGLAYFFQRHAATFSHVIAGEKSTEALTKHLLQFGRSALVLAIIGSVCLIFATKTIALLFLIVVMLVSAYFSLSLTKFIKQ